MIVDPMTEMSLVMQKCNIMCAMNTNAKEENHKMRKESSRNYLGSDDNPNVRDRYPRHHE